MAGSRPFLAVAAQVMRRILVDHARRHNVKRGRGVQHVSLEDVVVLAPGEDAETDLVALDEALVGLARIDPRKAQIVEMRFFGGLTLEEIGEVLKVSPGLTPDVAQDVCVRTGSTAVLSGSRVSRSRAPPSMNRRLPKPIERSLWIPT